MKTIINALAAFTLSACGTEDTRTPSLFETACPAVDIDAEFEEPIETVRALLIEKNDPRFPAERLKLICKFNSVSQNIIDAESENGVPLAGLTTVGYLKSGELVRFNIKISANEVNMRKLQTIYHEILHLYFDSHDDEKGLLNREIRAEEDLNEQTIMDLVRRAIFDEDYHEKMVIR